MSRAKGHPKGRWPILESLSSDPYARSVEGDSLREMFTSHLTFIPSLGLLRSSILATTYCWKYKNDAMPSSHALISYQEDYKFSKNRHEWWSLSINFFHKIYDDKIHHHVKVFYHFMTFRVTINSYKHWLYFYRFL